VLRLVSSPLRLSTQRKSCHTTKSCESHAQVERQQAEAERAKQEARELRQYRKSLVFRVRTASRPVACSVNLRRWGRNKLACCPCPIELACGRSASLRSPLQHRP